jgi:YHS domain-containing protein
MKPTSLWILLSIASLAPACSAPRAHALAPGHAECPVCAHDGDLACLDVKIDDATPRATWHERTYYFCSDDCRREFERTPERYVLADER